MLSLLLATLLTQATMSPTSDLSTNRVRATGAAGARSLRDHLRTLPDAEIVASGTTTGRGFADRFADILNVKDFGAKCDAQFVSTTVGWSGTDDTVAIQAAINYVSQNSKLRTIRFPEGACLYSRLYVYYDAALNPGYSSSRWGAMTFEGAGFSNNTNETYDKYGSILVSNAANGSAFYLGAPGNIVTRDVTIRGLSFQGRSADGFVVDARGVSYIQIESSEIIQNSTTGSGLNLENPLFGSLNRVRVLNRQSSPSTSGNAAVVVYFSTPWTFSGLFQIEQNSMFQGFSYGVHYTGGGLQTFNVKSSEIQGSKVGIYVSGGSIDNVGLEDFYAEGTLDSWVQDVGSRVDFPGGGWTYVGTIHNLNVNKWFGNGAFAARSHISLAMPNTVAITTVHVQDLVTPFLEIKSDPDGAKAYSVRGANFVATQSIAHDPFYIFSGETPFVAGLDWPTSDTSISVSAVVSRLDPWTGVGSLITTNDLVNRHPASTGDPCHTFATSGGTRRWSLCYDHTTSNMYLRDVYGSRTVMTFSPSTGMSTVRYGLTFDPATAVTSGGLGSDGNGTMRYCSDCTIANPCAAGGTGAIAKRLNGAWVCN